MRKAKASSSRKSPSKSKRKNTGISRSQISIQMPKIALPDFFPQKKSSEKAKVIWKKNIRKDADKGNSKAMLQDFFPRKKGTIGKNSGRQEKQDGAKPTSKFQLPKISFPNFTFPKMNLPKFQGKAEQKIENVKEKAEPKPANENKAKENIFSKLFRKKSDEEPFAHKASGISGIIKRKKEKEKEHKRNRLKAYLMKAGLEIETYILSKKIFNLAIIINLIISAYLIYRFSTDLKFGIIYVTTFMIFVWIFVFIGILFLLWLLLYLIIDLKIFRRRVDIEEVLPDYLQLTSANIRAGMPIDQALWYAVRPRFGVLANEIETVAKETMSGVDLNVALRKFSEKYDSPTLRRSINLLIEGLEAGGEVGDLLNNISINIKKMQLLKREMSANVTTYVIFITAATVFVSPFLFALSGQLLEVITKILSTIKLPATQATALPVKFSQTGLTTADFTAFTIVSLIISSFFSALIVATIRKGEVKAGIKYIPIFIIVSVALYFVYSSIFRGVFSSIF